MKKIFKFNVTWPIVIVCIICAWICWQPKDIIVPVQLMSVTQIQTELVSRGHDIKIDGKWGKNTDLALTIELTK
jgi:hypothetical protein